MDTKRSRQSRAAAPWSLGRGKDRADVVDFSPALQDLEPIPSEPFPFVFPVVLAKLRQTWSLGEWGLWKAPQGHITHYSSYGSHNHT